MELSPDILLVHIVPLLNGTEIRSLAQCSHALAAILGPLRFRESGVRRYGGSILDRLSTSTLQTIRHLSLDGLVMDHDKVFACADLSGVISANIMTMIQPGQRTAFGIWARQLESLVENDMADGEDPESSLSDVPSGSFENLHALRLDVSLPLQIESSLLIARNLHYIQFMPTYPQETEDEYLFYIRELEHLLRIVSDRNNVPGLKIIHVAPTAVTQQHQKIPHRQLMQSIWAAVHSHGGWKLQCSLPETFVRTEYPGAWEWWWSRRAWDLTITVKELAEFTAACERRNVFPRLADYVKGRIHVQTSGGTPQLSNLTNANTVVYCVRVHHGPTTDLTTALKLVTNDTRLLAICLRSYWGSIGALVPDAYPFKRVKSFSMEGPPPGHISQPFHYHENYGVAFIKGLALKSWARLVTLSLPAIAFQKEPENGVPYRSRCGLHLGSYDMKFLSEITTLKALSITNWISCVECCLTDEANFQTGLTHVPSNVEFVSIFGRLGYRGEIVPEWMKSYPACLRQILEQNRSDILVSFKNLFLVRIGKDPHIPKFTHDANANESSNYGRTGGNASGGSTRRKSPAARCGKRSGRAIGRSRSTGIGLKEKRRNEWYVRYSNDIRRPCC